MYLFKVISGKKLLAGAGIVAGLCVTAHAVFSTVTDISVSAAQRDLPIYSVEREEKVCSLTFDAAWGSDIMRKQAPRDASERLPMYDRICIVDSVCSLAYNEWSRAKRMVCWLCIFVT